MPSGWARVTVSGMSIDDGVNALVLQEFRLRAADSAGLAAQLVATLDDGIEPGVPLLVSVDDRRDVATMRALHPGERTDGHEGQSDALDRLVERWQPVARYTPRITERSDDPPSYYRLAVTGSGINQVEPDPPDASPPRPEQPGTATPVDLLWIGVPVGTFAGLLVLLGNGEDRGLTRADPRDWPLPLSSRTGVRIYDSRV